MFEDDPPNLLHCSSQGEPNVVLRPWTTSGLLMNRAVRTITSIFADRGPRCDSRGMLNESSIGFFSDCQTRKNAEA